ncbi:quinoprotein relay system zinc metallohydrolase 2 [uncultured Jannaschia sp.]|uniref:quinoprotein relay system zinc metallohydrolase 2 n=1 Tax=uncultured Jannaschia sp. TaxID=293347 RepID=UPI00260F7FB2|nr:quinoprotein relay system zinc metallohydrolase 2 [uncultured Jannaschia sp.]
MFEAVVTLCLAGAPDICRETLLPDIVGADAASCETRLPGTYAPPAGLVATSPPACREAPAPLAFTELAPGLYAHRGMVAEPDEANGGDVANIGFVVGSDAVAVIDAGTTRGVAEGVWRAIRARTDLPVRYLILTHVHPDHTLGAPFFAEAGAEVIGHAALDRALADRQANYLESLEASLGTGAVIGSGAVAADIAVASTETVNLGNRVLELRAWATAHTGTDVTVLDRESGTVFAGDLVFDDHVPALDGSLRGWQDALDALTGMELTAIVPGHGGPRLDWPVGAKPMRRYLDTLARDTKAAIAEGDRMADAVERIAASEADDWALFDAYNARNATVAFTELEWE